MSAELLAGRRTYRWPLIIDAVMLALTIAVGVTILVLHHRTENPHTAGRLPLVSGSRQVNQAIERRAQQFANALETGDESRLRAMTLTKADRDNVAAFITAFGHRNVRITSLQSGEFGDTGNLELAVPCNSRPEQRALVLFAWKRTSFLSSGWYAIINQPGTVSVLSAGCGEP
jgi:hypothetical protein